MSAAKDGAKGGTSEPKEEGPSFIQRFGGAVDGAVAAVSGGPFGPIIGELKGDDRQPPPTGYKLLGFLPAKGPGADDDDTPKAAQTPGVAAKQKTRGA